MDTRTILSSIMSRLRDAQRRIVSFIEGIPLGAQLIRFIRANPLYKGVFILGSGTAIAQLIGILSMPFITRLYTPEDLGLLAVYASVLAIVGVGATLRYEFAYTLPEENRDATNLFALSLILLFITTTIIAVVFFFGRDLLSHSYDDFGLIEPYLWFFLIGFFGTGLYTMLNYWAIRQRDYKRITYTKINQGFSGALSKIALGLLAFGPTGLIIGHIASQIAGIGTLGQAMWKKERMNLKCITLRGMKHVAQTYKSFPKYNFPASIVNTMALQLPPIFLLTLYDARVAGLYALAYMVVVMPGSVISGSMGQAYLGEASKMVREKSRELRSVYVRTLKHLTMVAIPLIGIPALCAPFVFGFIFGEAWVEAGWYCWPLGLMVIVAFVVSPTSFLHIYGYNHWQLPKDIFRSVLIIIVFYLSHLIGVTGLNAIYIYSVVMIIMYFITVGLNFIAISNFNNSIN